MTDPNHRFLTDAEQAAVCRVIERALPHTGVSVLYQDLDLIYLWERNIPAVWSAGPVVGKTDTDFLPSAEAERLTACKRAAIRSGERQFIELCLTDDRRMHWFDVVIDVQTGAGGGACGVITTIIDTTDQKRREQTLSTLLREVSHRSKNLLAIILSIAGQTGRHSRSVDIFLARFRGRIQSLAYSQDLVTSSNWRGAALGELIAQQTARYCADPARNIRFEGPNVNLNPNATLHVGLGLHELAVNSVSFGALSRPDGVISITSAFAADGSLVLRWTERLHSASPDVIGERRFGGVALERIVPSAVNGVATLEVENGVLDYRVTIPPDQFDQA